MRLNRHIADSGFCSRREADRLVAEGRVTVNGLRARIGARAGERDERGAWAEGSVNAKVEARLVALSERRLELSSQEKGTGEKTVATLAKA